jgi:DNA-binding NtrC family response regulator
MTKRILVVDDEENIREGLKTVLEMEGYEVDTAIDGNEAINKINTNVFDLVILDLKMPNLDGYEFLNIVSKTDPYLPIIILTGHGSLQEAVELTKKGAFDYFLKPPDIDNLLTSINKALDLRRGLLEKNKEKVSQPYESLDSIVGESEEIKNIKLIIRKVAPTDATVLITGESGTGKELIANAIHALSNRRNGPFIKVNCGSIPETLLEAELFGHEKGAFTGAINRRKGRFELAHKGTIFLDEIGEISPKLQVALLRVLQDKEFQRVGGEETIKVDVRIITATNKNLEEEVKKGNFREDLFYRINIISIHVPPLRQRKVDIPILANYFLKKYAKIHNKNIEGISKELMNILLEYSWPGNIRELQNFIESSVIMCSENILTVSSIPSHYQTKLLQPKVNITISQHKKEETELAENDKVICIKLGTSLKEAEKKIIEKTLEDVGYNKSKAASILGITRKTLIMKMREYGIKD